MDFHTCLQLLLFIHITATLTGANELSSSNKSGKEWINVTSIISTTELYQGNEEKPLLENGSEVYTDFSKFISNSKRTKLDNFVDVLYAIRYHLYDHIE